MKVMMLDVDGVLNSKQHLYAVKDKKVRGAKTLSNANLFVMKCDVNQNNMWALGYLLKEIPDLKIVISSAWRLHYDLSDFKELFKIFKLDETRIIGKTPKQFTSERRHEIREWLSDYEALHGKVVDWVSVDDHIIFNLEDPDKFREHTTNSWVGLTMPDVFKIIRHFYPLSQPLEINI